MARRSVRNASDASGSRGAKSTGGSALPVTPHGRRFRVALSYPREKRAFVSQVADHLSQTLRRERVFYDGYYEAELARPDLDVYLGQIYHDDSDLVVPFYCGPYGCKKWCQLEWRQMRDILFNLAQDRIMPFRFDDTPIPGVLSIDGYIKIEKRSARGGRADPSASIWLLCQ